MDQIVPRWEWRTFGEHFGAAEPRFAALAAEKVQTSEEIYLLATASDANVKIRDQLLDIKMLERVDANGLEQWRPVLKEPFPLAASAVAQSARRSACRRCRRRAESLSLDQLLAELARPAGRSRRRREQDAHAISRPRLRLPSSPTSSPMESRCAPSPSRMQTRPRSSPPCEHGARRLPQHQLPPRSEAVDRPVEPRGAHR